ncbi:glycoside hydrolase [Algoriphagus chordae]|uniref:O-glycosyl hydrolase n=1 Tax=Algoriphagus chordae TaxID=237019 RepID=A0A2W7R816_9BACT|nr:glycoside hydrolase [Algoriphagus chordae]PZX56554.1 O-glycosyl hydrolase [Algoriphagus chordae]
MKKFSKNNFSTVTTTTDNEGAAVKKPIIFKRKAFLLKLLLVANFAVLFAYPSSGQGNQAKMAADNTIEVNVLSKERNQVIEHFGASDAWSTQFVGLWPDQKKNAIAELLFSKEEDEDGSPKGIGLSMWRFNVGAGSTEQGQESGIRDEWRRAESFLTADGSYDWSKQAGQVWFAKAAKEFGLEKLLVFPNSPPVYMTKTGKAYAKDGKSNLAEKNFNDYGEYLAQVIKGLGEKGLKVDYVSPVNEPQWDWSDGGQEGTPFSNLEIAGIVKALDQALSRNMLSTKIDVAEAGKINYLFENADKEERGEQIANFFNPGSANYIGDLAHLSRTISAHSYFTTSPYIAAVQQRQNLNAALGKVEGLSYWMSEYCILGGNEGEIKGNGRDLGIDPALYIARVIHNDLTVSNASAWHWWIAISPYNYKDGLIYIDKQKTDGEFYESKMLWALGNYSRFIRPGYQRLAVEINNEKQQGPDFLASAYESIDQRELVLVFVNSSDQELKVNLAEDGNSISIKALFLTSKDKDLESVARTDSDGAVTIPARSIMTVLTEN